MAEGRDPKRIVADGYDRIAERYVEADRASPNPVREKYLAVAMAAASPGARALDLGCGTGELVTAPLSTRYVVTGVDISPASIGLARHAVPDADFVVADMSEVAFPSATFDVVTAFFSLIHLPGAEQTTVVDSIARWLRPAGTLIATFGADEPGDGYEEDWLGSPMFWGSCGAAAALAAVATAGLDLASTEIEAEDGGAGPRHLWLVARNGRARASGG